MADPRQTLRDSAQFEAMPEEMQSWILASPHAATRFADFFEKKGMIDFEAEIGLPRYVPRDPPRIEVDRSTWIGLQQPGSEYAQRHVFGTLAHEIGHDRFNTGNVPFTGRTADEYVQYRAGLEAQAIFTAFPIFKDLEKVPAFKDGKPFGSIGYLSGLELGAMYGEWKAGKINDAGVIEQIAAKVADTPYTLDKPVQDQNADGRVTHRDAYLQDYQNVLRKPPQASVDGPTSPTDPKHPDNAMLEQLRGCVRGLDQQVGKGWDDSSERLCASALVMTKQKGFTAEDKVQVAFNNQTDTYAAGALLHVFRHGPDVSPDPAANRAHMSTADALSMPVEERCSQVQAIGLAQAEAQQALARGPDDPDRGGPKFTM